MQYPENLKYTAQHEWLRLEGNTAIIGITDYAQHQLGDVVFVELPEVGEQLKREESFGVVESTKSVSDLYAPVSGKVVASNAALIASPEQVNQDAYGQAWMIKIEMSHPEEVEALMDASTYQRQLGNA